MVLEPVLDQEIANRRHIVKPIVYHGRTRKKLSTTRHKRGTHYEDVLVRIRIEGNEYALELRLNQGLLPEGHVISYREEDRNRTVLRTPKNEKIEFCQYTGHVKGKFNSWVAVSTCYGLRGVFHDGTKIRYIEPLKGTDIQSLHQVYDYEYVGENKNSEHNAQGPAKNQDQLTKNRQYNLRKRQKRDESFRKPGFFNANEKSRYIELVLVADHAQYLGVDRNLRVLHHQLQETINIANAIFSPHNIYIALTGVEVWTVEDRIILDPDTQTTLQQFTEYLTELFKNIGNHDHAQLVTDTDFLQGHIGLAYVKSMCSPGSCSIIYRSARNVSAATIMRTAYNMAHELGHSFGMRHDYGNCTCPAKYCVMSEKEQRVMPTYWSDCSLEVLDADFADGDYSCLRNKPVRLFGPASCGNGFLDPGEQCDCGVTMKKYKHPCYECCDPVTCTFRSNAQCVRGACCNLQLCQLIPAGTVCRAAKLDCDLPEYCDGMSEFCPEDVIKVDAVPCTGEMCARQKCVSVDDQRRQIIRQQSKGCLANCSGHGVCNSNGYCHCDDGYAPPMCDLPGFGGSVVSGPTRHLESPNCSCKHETSPTVYAGAIYDTKPTSPFTYFLNLSGGNIYVFVLGSTLAIIAIVLLICFSKCLCNSFCSRSSVGPAKKANIIELCQNDDSFFIDSYLEVDLCPEERKHSSGSKSIRMLLD